MKLKCWDHGGVFWFTVCSNIRGHGLWRLPRCIDDRRGFFWIGWHGINHSPSKCPHDMLSKQLNSIIFLHKIITINCWRCSKPLLICAHLETMELNPLFAFNLHKDDQDLKFRHQLSKVHLSWNFCFFSVTSWRIVNRALPSLNRENGDFSILLRDIFFG